MRAKWLLELDLFTDTELGLIDAIKRSGREVKTMKYVPFDDKLVERISEDYEEEDCVVFYGSLNLGRKIMKQADFIPGVYLKEKNYECTSYYPVFGDELLHNSYLMMPYGDLLRRKNELYDIFGTTLFIRPNSGFKEFTGTVLEYDNFEDGVELAGFYDVEPDLLVLVSDAKHIQKEWRFVVVNNEVVSGSLYRVWTIGQDKYSDSTRDYVLLNSKKVDEYCTDEKAFEYARKVAKMYNPDTAWTIDITLTGDGEYKVIEIGCFSCAGMYANDLDDIVEKVSEAAEQEWNIFF